MRNTNHMYNLEQDQQAQFHLQPPPNMNNMLPVADPMTGFVTHHQPGNSETALPYGIAQYNNVHNHLLAANPGLGLATTTNYYNQYATPPGPSVFPFQGHQFFDGYGGAFKRKSAEGYFGNFHYGNSVAGSSSRPGPVGGETMVAQNPNHLIPVQAIIPAPAEGYYGSTLAWGQAPALPYMQGNGVNSGFSGMGNMVTEGNRISSNFQLHPPPMYPQSLHHLPQPVQGPYYPQVPSTAYGLQRNSAFQVGTEMGPGYVAPLPPGVAVYPPSQGRPVLPGPTLRRHALPRLNLLPADEVAMLEIPGYHDMGNGVDNHSDMRMDVDSMSYEELLALEEHIGSVAVGLTEEAISNRLKTQTHTAPSNSVELENRETDFCTICQTNFENKEMIGTLDCGHEYHADCIKQWLVVKNLCPICKSSALRNDSIREGR